MLDDLASMATELIGARDDIVGKRKVRLSTTPPKRRRSTRARKPVKKMWMLVRISTEILPTSCVKKLKPKKIPKNAIPCYWCGDYITPLRRGPDNTILCNPCGLGYARGKDKSQTRACIKKSRGDWIKS